MDTSILVGQRHVLESVQSETVVAESPSARQSLIHLFSTVIPPHRCPIVTRNLELIQQALAASNGSNEKESVLIQGKDVDVTLTPYIMKKRRKELNKLNSYNT